MMWITFMFLTLGCISTSQAADDCRNVIPECQQDPATWTGCYEDRITTCDQRGRNQGVFRQQMNSSQEVEVNPTKNHRVCIPSSALRESRGDLHKEEVLVVVTTINSTYFKQSIPRGRRRMEQPHQPVRKILGELVLVVKAGNSPVANLSQPVKLFFKHEKMVENGDCVFWQESGAEDGTGHWSTNGCTTNKTDEEFICSCSHLSFFAVLVNPALSVDEKNAVNLSYITYVGSALSVLFAFISLFIYIGLHRRRPEKAIGMHMQLTGALLCLHLGFLLSSLWVLMLGEKEDSWVCRGLGLFLHWSLLATFTWIALEGFHLYLLLVRVFNIYVHRYLLKLSMVGWGLPTVVAVVCGISGVYGKYTLEFKDSINRTSTSKICWMSSDFPQRLLVGYITMAFLCLVILYNSCMLGLVVFKLWRIRAGRGGYESSSDWKKMQKEKGPRLWKDCATVLGLSWVLGLPWGVASSTYLNVPLPGIYLFTILNSLQGFIMFLWSVALSFKSRSDSNSSTRDPSSQKMMTSSFKK
ncbi:adhesion G-protein coupled receptor G1-like isoform X2 [Melanotaenia boesemani]|uniref:adhesion G-protein coupled receptor G1-like isoform X2 n=1 Tax=Melanotaenia boesemani TaxID=1250792 RepID=UPI001C05061C|nr:adhesion G-protein coupled receptor G1-like isoform X2 [Melanotaenia boesemani]